MAKSLGSSVKEIFLITAVLSSTSVMSAQWQPLVDKDLSHWDIFMGIPHKSSGVKGYEHIEDVRIGKPIGLNKDPLNVFSVIKENGEWVIKITGEVFAGLVTKQDFENYHFKAQFKWGDKKWEPRLNKKRNSGILYHSMGNYDDFWNVWMSSLEFEVQETDTGDFITISDTSVQAQCPSEKRTNGKYYYKENAKLIDMAWIDGFVTGRCWKNQDTEKPHGQWNTVELITLGDMAIHIVNGTALMIVHNPQYHDGQKWVKMTKGKIQLQSEAAEVYYKNIKIKPITELPSQYIQYKR